MTTQSETPTTPGKGVTSSDLFGVGSKANGGALYDGIPYDAAKAVFSEGYNAGLLATNPHAPGTWQRDAWRQGFERRKFHNSISIGNPRMKRILADEVEFQDEEVDYD